mmetsp:Transcript_4886/g.15487  ORF Transcript_4886/g.15487 Transcript_4886/m.15487 type:complete len:217 (-) Transcript_4886:1078-1728(-)
MRAPAPARPRPPAPPAAMLRAAMARQEPLHSLRRTARTMPRAANPSWCSWTLSACMDSALPRSCACSGHFWRRSGRRAAAPWSARFRQRSCMGSRRACRNKTTPVTVASFCCTFSSGYSCRSSLRSTPLSTMPRALPTTRRPGSTLHALSATRSGFRCEKSSKSALRSVTAFACGLCLEPDAPGLGMLLRGQNRAFSTGDIWGGLRWAHCPGFNRE